MSIDPDQALRPAAQSDTIPILIAGSVSRTRSVVRVIRGGCQTPKASDLVLHEPGWPSFGPARPHHAGTHHRPATATTRLPFSHGITPCVREGM
jgi:hypothetical protein